MAGKTENLWGIHSVTEALKAGKRKIEKVVLVNKKTSQRLSEIQDLASARGIPVERYDAEHLDKIAQSSRHQGAVLETAVFPAQSAAQVADLVKKSKKSCFILVVENMEDPHNLGALIRTALCAGVDYILIPKHRSVGPTPTVSRTSAGAMEHADIFMITNTVNVLKSLKEAGVWVSGLDAQGDKSLYEADLTGHVALVIGGEHKGIRPLVKKECDFVLSIPNMGRINSLNASVAGGVAMFEALRQRRDNG